MFAIVLPGRLPLTKPQQVDATHLVFQLEEAGAINHVTVFMDGSQAFPPGYSATVHFLWPVAAGAGGGAAAMEGAGAEWKLLGCLRNSKPSAIFKLRGMAIPSGASASPAGTSSSSATPFASSSLPSSASTAAAAPPPPAAGVTAQIGISIEPDAAVDAQMQALAHATGGAAGAAGVGPAEVVGSAGAAAGAAGAVGGFGSAGAGTGANAGALVKAGSAGGSGAGAAGQAERVQIALAIAPRIAKNAFSYLSSFAPDSAPQTAPLLQKWLEQFDRKLRSQGWSYLEKEE